MEAISVIAKLTPILLLLVSVQAQESFPSDYPSLLSESEFLDDSEESNVPFQTQQSPFLTEEQNYLPSAFETQSHLDVNSLISSESEFPEDSEDNVQPRPLHHPIFHSPPPPSESPSSPKIAPSSSVRPSSPKTCKATCAANCVKKKVPVLHGLCNKVCRRRCILHYSQLIYVCTNQCAEAMPKKLKSDPEKAAGYVDHCYQKCIKKF